MKSRTFCFGLLIFLSCIFCQKSNSQTFTSVRFNSDSVLFDGSNVNINYTSGCTGKVSMVKGCAKIIKPGGECGTPGTSSNASVGSSVESGDKIQVCSQSIIDITMPDGSVVRGAPGSEINIDEASCQDNRSFSFRLLMGSLWNEVSPYIGGENKYEVRTENAVTGSRGTKFLVKVAYDTVFSNPERTVWDVNIATTIAVLEGKVEVSNTNGATLTDNASQVKLYEDFENKRITLEEFQRRVAEIQNNNKVLVEAGMETTVLNSQAPGIPVRTNYTLENFSQDKLLNK